ncbi:MAG TPA: molecular chaperone DnaK [Planctomycetaceae bacterium]|nr:molecular chaperone DnaK [Planctomycetaceae bacterium]
MLQPQISPSHSKRAAALERIRIELIQRRDAIRSAMRGNSEPLGQLIVARGDCADIAAEAISGTLSSHLVAAEAEQLNAIEDALTRLGLGEFGDCADCNLPIPLERLRALPQATLCIECQLKSEKLGS